MRCTALAARPLRSSLAIAPAARHSGQAFARAYERIISTVRAPIPRVGLVDDALERAVVIAVRDQAQVRKRVLDFRALERSADRRKRGTGCRR